MVPAAEEERPLRFSGRLVVNPAAPELDGLDRSLGIHSGFAVDVCSLTPAAAPEHRKMDGEDLASVTFGVQSDPDAG
ncbi:hypothetical protein [Streptosporangium minutum]|uniref:Uncharacterized protein n=1 Tax=Streptosporangium minutum TaxID=569862 RepID=A0A243RV31_9ACTN|nr:hypothetical protein [Streptosporangium minutum]OUC99067.1 hypothetical protein CA984_04700 [Streptosporangium minutum]